MKLVITCRFDESVLERLRRDWDLTYLPPAPGTLGLPRSELQSALSGADILVAEGDPITADVLATNPQLKAVIATHGNPNIIVDVPAATAAGVLVCHAPGRNDVTVAEVAVALMVVVSRHLIQGHNALMAGQWSRKPLTWAFFEFMGTELENRTAGLIGFGNIGRQVCKRLRAFDMNVITYDPYVPDAVVEAVGAKKVPLDELLRTSDYVSLHVHVTPETKNMIGARAFALMKPTAYLINTGRAGAVDEQAMIEALRTKRIAGAALDVHHHEPLPADHPLIDLSNVILFPHIAGTTVEMVRRHSALAEASLAALRQGKVPPHLYNRDVLSTDKLRLKLKPA